MSHKPQEEQSSRVARGVRNPSEPGVRTKVGEQIGYEPNVFLNVSELTPEERRSYELFLRGTFDKRRVSETKGV